MLYVIFYFYLENKTKSLNIFKCKENVMFLGISLMKRISFKKERERERES